MIRPGRRWATALAFWSWWTFGLETFGPNERQIRVVKVGVNLGDWWMIEAVEDGAAMARAGRCETAAERVCIFYTTASRF